MNSKILSLFVDKYYIVYDPSMNVEDVMFNMRNFIDDNELRVRVNEPNEQIYYILHPYKYDSKLNRYPIIEDNNSVKGLYNVICDVEMFTNIRNIVVLNLTVAKLCRKICEKKNKKFQIIGPDNIRNPLFWDSWPKLRQIYIKSKRKIQRKIIDKLKRLSPRIRIDMGYWIHNIERLRLCQRNIRKWYIKKILWKQIGMNKVKFIEVKERNLREKSFIKDKYLVTCSDKITAKQAKGLYRFDRTENIELIRSLVKQNKSINVPVNVRPVFFRIQRMLKMNPDYDFSNLFFSFRSRGARIIIYKETKDNHLNEFEFDGELHKMRYEMGKYFTEKSNQHGVYEKTRHPMSCKGLIFTMLSDGYRNRRFEEVEKVGILHSPNRTLLRTFWCKIYPNVRILRICCWNRDVHQFRRVKPSHTIDEYE